MVHLVRADRRLMDAALEGDDALGEALGHAVAAGWATFTEALRPTRDAVAASPHGAAWGARLFVSGDPPELVGWGGFKGPPDDGVVELGYEVAESHRGRGIATAATRAMLAEAFFDAAVTAVIAHTLPQRNASNHVLEKVGFIFDGEAHEDGDVVWRFMLARSGVRARELGPGPDTAPTYPGGGMEAAGADLFRGGGRAGLGERNRPPTCPPYPSAVG